MKVIKQEDFPLAERTRLIIRAYEVGRSPLFPDGIKFAFQYLYRSGEHWLEIARVDNYRHDSRKTGCHLHRLDVNGVEYKALSFIEIEAFIIAVGDAIVQRLERGEHHGQH